MNQHPLLQLEVFEMNHSRLIIAVLLASMLLLVACGRSTPPAMPKQTSAPVQQVVIEEQQPAQEAETVEEVSEDEEETEASVAAPSGEDHAVQIKGFAFAPRTITVKVGDTVTWTNEDSARHTATADDGSFDTGLLAKGQSGSVTFDTPGTYMYFCTPHPNMKGTIVVEE